jgi:hypothetical protein
VGVGEDLGPAALAALAGSIPELTKVFLMCPTAAMVWREAQGVFEQAMFTYDGDGAALVVWDSGDRWVVTFVSSDDAAAYRSLSPELDWRVLGRPLPFVRCDALWIQPFVDGDLQIMGIGVRQDEDVQGTAEQPLFVWGSTVESLLRRPATALRLPAGMPAMDANSSIQYFVDGETVRSPAAGADQLTLADLMRHCSHS